MHRSRGVRHIYDALCDVKVSHRTHLGKVLMMMMTTMMMIFISVQQTSVGKVSWQGSVLLQASGNVYIGIY